MLSEVTNMSPRHSLLGKRREGMHGESSYGVRTPEQCVFSGSNPDLTTVQAITNVEKPFSHINTVSKAQNIVCILIKHRTKGAQE